MEKRLAVFLSSLMTIWAAVETTAPKKSVVIEKNVLSNPAWIDADCLDDPDYSGYLYTE